MLTQAGPDEEDAITALFDAGFEAYGRGLGRDGVTRNPWVSRALKAGHVFWVEHPFCAAILEEKGTTLSLDALVVHPDRQRGGVGRKALASIEAYARQAGLTEIALHTAQIFTHLVAFYSSAGYRVTAVGPHPRGRDDRLRVYFVKSLV